MATYEEQLKAREDAMWKRIQTAQGKTDASITQDRAVNKAANPTPAPVVQTTTSSPLPSTDEQLKAMSAAKTPEEKEALYQQNLQKRKEKLAQSLDQNPNVAPEYVQLFQEKWNPVTGKIEGATEEEWAAIPDRFKRDEASEGTMVEQYGGDDQANAYIATYGNEKTGALIESGQVDPNQFTAQQLMDMGLTTERLSHLIETGDLRPELLEQLVALGQDTGIAKANLDATPQPTNAKLNVLQEALQAKSNFQNQQIGTSELFNMAGVSGYEVLSQSLGQRSQEMKQKWGSAANMIEAVGGSMVDTYKAMAENYASVREDFDTTMERLLKIDADAKSHERLLELEGVRLQNEKDLSEFKEELARDTAAMEERANPATGTTADIYSPGGGVGVIDPETGEVRSFSDEETKVGGQVYKKSIIEGIFNLGGIGDWCGVFASTLSTAPAVGNSWGEKRQRITHRENPTAGDKLLIPLAVKTDKDYGHVATVLDYNPENGNVWVVESNRDGRQNRGAGKGVVTFGVYNINEMGKNYGSDWGFAKGDFKKSVKDALNKAGSLDLGPLASAAKNVATGNPAQAFIDLLSGVPEMIGQNALDRGSAIVAEENASKSYVDRYVEITGDESVLPRNEDGTPTSTRGKELQAALSGKSPEEVNEYFDKLAKKHKEEDEKDLAPALDVAKIKEHSKAVSDGLAGGDSIDEIKAQYDEAVKKGDMRKEDMEAIFAEYEKGQPSNQEIIDFTTPLAKKGMLPHQIQDAIRKKWGEAVVQRANVRSGIFQ